MFEFFDIIFFFDSDIYVSLIENESGGCLFFLIGPYPDKDSDSVLFNLHLIIS